MSYSLNRKTIELFAESPSTMAPAKLKKMTHRSFSKLQLFLPLFIPKTLCIFRQHNLNITIRFLFLKFTIIFIKIDDKKRIIRYL